MASQKKSARKPHPKPETALPAVPAFKRFAWDGVAFNIPANWELASYIHQKEVRRINMEDDFAHRLDVEWLRVPGRLDTEKIQQRYTKASKGLAKTARETIQVKDLPAGWAAFIYVMSDGRRLLTAWCLQPQKKFFIFFSIHFDADNAGACDGILKELTSSFALHDGALIPWQCYDVCLQVGKSFSLRETEFLAGRKKFVFQWNGRRLYVWFFSLADIVLKKRPLLEWAAEFMAGQKGLRGPHFFVENNGIRTRRKAWRPLHADQIATLCFRYQCGAQHFVEQNRIMVWAFHHRRKQDLDHLQGFDVSVV